MGEAPAVPAFPLSLFPIAQVKIRALLEEADEAAHAGFSALHERLVSRARAEATAVRAQIVGWEA